MGGRMSTPVVLPPVTALLTFALLMRAMPHFSCVAIFCPLTWFALYLPPHHHRHCYLPPAFCAKQNSVACIVPITINVLPPHLRVLSLLAQLSSTLFS